jgi:hypothetical protein
MTTDKPTGLALLRKPFPENQISKLPKGTKAQNECPANEKINCKVCGGWHHPRVIHLDYVGHAALTDRLLDCDPEWNWEFQSVGQNGYPVIDQDGGFWIRLTVCGVTRLGYGDAQGKTGGNAMKERIGDALRNAAMRFGAALDLWHKGDLHVDDAPEPKPQPDYAAILVETKTLQELGLAWQTVPNNIKPVLTELKDSLKAYLTPKTEETDWKILIADADDMDALTAIYRSMSPAQQEQYNVDIDYRSSELQGINSDNHWEY